MTAGPVATMDGSISAMLVEVLLAVEKTAGASAVPLFLSASAWLGPIPSMGVLETKTHKLDSRLKTASWG